MIGLKTNSMKIREVALDASIRIDTTLESHMLLCKVLPFCVIQVFVVRVDPEQAKTVLSDEFALKLRSASSDCYRSASSAAAL